MIKSGVSTIFEETKKKLMVNPKTWLVTGCAGFIGSNIVESLIGINQRVIGIDNLSTGKRTNLEDIRQKLPDRYELFHFIEGDITNLEDVNKACKGVDVILHQAALGSVPRSIENPLNTHHNNSTGALTILEVARKKNIQRVVYASSSSVYGDHPDLPKFEDRIGKQLSPYAVSKYTNELYAQVFSLQYGLETVGLRYFNVFGQRQDPFGSYAAVIPLWVKSMLQGEQTYINGDGETSRDFCYVENVVQANILSGAASQLPSKFQVYNVACGERTTLNQLYQSIESGLLKLNNNIKVIPVRYRSERAGDVRHSLASIDKISSELGYRPTHLINSGIEQALEWYVKNLII